MADIVPAATRSRMMAGIRGKDTKPELLLRRELHRRGFRFRLHRRDLPGTPDLVFPRWSAVLFVDGCFWHGHDCHLFRLPKTRPEFWRAKIDRNRENDRRSREALATQGWRVGKVWECALKGRTRRDFDALANAVANWIPSGRDSFEISGIVEDA